MNMNKRRRIFKNEINPGSMADIGFLLLIFFLVSTTINTDKGILVKLPPLEVDTPTTPIPPKNLCSVLVNKDNKLLVRNKEMDPEELTAFLKEFITNPQQLANFPNSPKKAVISLQNDRATHYETYIKVYNQIRKAYNELRDEKAQTLHEKNFEGCTETQKTVIRQMIPMIISEADPVDLKI